MTYRGDIMAKQIVVDVNNVSVRFNLATEKIDNLKEYCIKLIKKKLMFQEFFALKDINFKVVRGESWGIIGKNGSGKSTLLKLICGILKPYKGTVVTQGSIAPLIELGAGFDGRLTARENIFLNGALLGYNKEFMNKNIDDIIDFAEIGQFIDVPVQNFSSGMQARLGFAIATIVKPDILVIDEVLSVGDAAFQKKCELRMSRMLTEDTTLLFVSHSKDAVRRMCKKAIWLDKGHVVMAGDSYVVCGEYDKSCN